MMLTDINQIWGIWNESHGATLHKQQGLSQTLLRARVKLES